MLDKGDFPLLLETIKIENGKIAHIKWHNQRCNKTRRELFSDFSSLKLEKHLTKRPMKGLFRCRILYRHKVEKIEFIPYTLKNKEKFKIIQHPLKYSYKFANRTLFNGLIPKNYDEIIFEQNGFLSDTTIANIAFYNGKSWITPKKPLLEGTCRARLVAKGFLREENIKVSMIHNYTHFALMNAMIGFQIQKNVTIE